MHIYLMLKFIFFKIFIWLHRPYLQFVGSSSLTRGLTQPPAQGAQSLSHWTTRKVPETHSFNHYEHVQNFCEHMSCF